MRRLLKISTVLLLVSSVMLLMNLFDILAFTPTLYRVCGVICMICLFLTVYSRVWLIRYRRI